MLQQMRGVQLHRQPG